MPRFLFILLTLICLHAQAASNDANSVYRRGLDAVDRLRQLTTQQPADHEALSQTIDNLADSMRRAAELGHPAARLYQAQMVLSQAQPNAASRQQACASLDQLAKSGVVAAAVANFQLCDQAFKRYRLDALEHLAIIDTLEQTLQHPDPAARYYPLGNPRSQCFPQEQALSEAQFRSEAAFIIGTARPAETKDAMQSSLRWLERAFGEGCAARFDMREALRKQLAQAH